MVPGTLEAGTVDDKLYGLLVSLNVKGLVFYPKKAWDEAGYPAPTTIDELNALTEQIKADGNTPWCMGIESDTATGWPATDWFEDLVAALRRRRTATTSGSPTRSPFDSDLVREAAAEFEELMFTDGNVLGGRKAIASTNFGTAGNPMFDAKPGCWMYKQGSFITGFFPEDDPGRPRRQRRRLRLPAGRGRWREPGRSVVATWPCCSATPRTPRP